MTRKTCTEPGCTRPQSTEVIGPDLCNPCNDYAEWENTHNDEGHDETVDNGGGDGCPVCHPELDPRKPTKKGHTNTATKGAHRSHAGCGHPRTPAGRAACRKAGGPKE